MDFASPAFRIDCSCCIKSDMLGHISAEALHRSRLHTEPSPIDWARCSWTHVVVNTYHLIYEFTLNMMLNMGNIS